MAGVRTLGALAAGAALGAATAAGSALLLYTGQGFLRAAGLLIASTIMAVAAGVWVGVPEDAAAEPPRPAGGGGNKHEATTAQPARPAAAGLSSRGRWVALIVALLAGGLFTVLWGSREPLRAIAVGGALAVLFVLALPAYTAGALLVALHARERAGLTLQAAGGVGPGAIAGAALGILLSTTVLIQNIEPYGIYYGCAGLLTLVSMFEWRSSVHPSAVRDDMRDHVAIITGAGNPGQLGFAIARRFVQAGASVVITDIGEVDASAAALGSTDRVAAVRADLTDEAQVLHVLQTARERFGRIDSLINTAGGLTLMKPIGDTSAAEWEREIRRNAGTAMLMSRAALPLLRETGGAIVNFASPAGQQAVAGLGAYSAGKAAVIALTRTLALEEREHGVRVNAVAPGPMDTEQNLQSMANDPDAKFVTRADVAEVVLFLAGPGARGISGETIRVPGPTLE